MSPCTENFSLMSEESPRDPRAAFVAILFFALPGGVFLRFAFRRSRCRRAQIHRSARTETRRRSGADPRDLHRRRARRRRAAPRRPGADHHGHARRPERLHERHHPAHFGLAGAGGRLRFSYRRARRLRRILYFVVSRHCRHGSGHPRGRGFPSHHDWRLRAAD